MVAAMRDFQKACENREFDLIHLSDKSESHAILFENRPASFHHSIVMLQRESGFSSGKCAAIFGHRSPKLRMCPRDIIEDDGTAAQKYRHKHNITLMHSRKCTRSFSGGQRGEVAGCASREKARPRGLVPTSSRLRLSSSPTPTSTPTHQNAAKTRLHVV